MKTLAGLQNILLFITNKCNLKCSYCYVCQGGNTMSFDIAKQAIDNIDDGTVVDFFGGEALLELPLLNQIVDYAHDNNRRLVFQLFSNATRYDDEVKAFLAKGVNIGISFDGLSMEDRTHSNEISNLILNNAKAMKKDIPSLGVKVAITPQNVDKLVENVEYIYSQGFNFISHFILREDVWDKDSIALYEKRVNQLMDWYEAHLPAAKLDYFDGFLIGNKRRTGCWAGCDGCAINFNGDLHPCQRFLTNGSPFVIGHVSTGITNQMFRKYDISKFVGCKQCPSFNRCNNVCIAAQWENGAMMKPISCVCENTNITFEAVQKLEPHRKFLENRLIRLHNGTLNDKN